MKQVESTNMSDIMVYFAMIITAVDTILNKSLFVLGVKYSLSLVFLGLAELGKPWIGK